MMTRNCVLSHQCYFKGLRNDKYEALLHNHMHISICWRWKEYVHETKGELHQYLCLHLTLYLQKRRDGGRASVLPQVEQPSSQCGDSFRQVRAYIILIIVVVLFVNIGVIGFILILIVEIINDNNATTTLILIIIAL